MSNTKEPKHRIGACKAFEYEGTLEIGQIIAAKQNEETEEYLYDFVVVKNDEEVTLKNIPETAIAVLKHRIPPLQGWAAEHVEEISASFGKDMSRRCLVVYDKLDDVEEEFRDFFFPGAKHFKFVAGKWVGVLA